MNGVATITILSRAQELEQHSDVELTDVELSAEESSMVGRSALQLKADKTL
jgi:hypothetical protein